MALLNLRKLISESVERDSILMLINSINLNFKKHIK
jgi:hypothetical protein